MAYCEQREVRRQGNRCRATESRRLTRTAPTTNEGAARLVACRARRLGAEADQLLAKFKRKLVILTGKSVPLGQRSQLLDLAVDFRHPLFRLGERMIRLDFAGRDFSPVTLEDDLFRPVSQGIRLFPSVFRANRRRLFVLRFVGVLVLRFAA